MPSSVFFHLSLSVSHMSLHGSLTANDPFVIVFGIRIHFFFRASLLLLLLLPQTTSNTFFPPALSASKVLTKLNCNWELALFGMGTQL